MASVTDVTQLNGNFKEIYSSQIENLIPESAKMLKLVSFSQTDEIGNKYHQPVILTQEHGITFSAPDQGAFTLNSPIALTMKDASVDAYQALIRSQISYEAAAKASTSKKAFRKVTELLVQNMYESIAKKTHIRMIYGGTGHGTGTALGSVDSSANASATSTVISFAAGQFAPGIWCGSENMKIQLYLTASPYTIVNGSTGIFTITSADFDNKTLTVSGVAADITALDSALLSGAHDIYEYGSYGSEMTGLDGIILNTGTLFGISAATYTLWKGNSYAAGGAALTIAKTLNAVQRAVAKGLDEDVTMMCSPATWGNLNAELAGNRRYDGSYKRTSGENGFEAIQYFSQNGKLDIISEPCVKEGEAFLFPPKRCKRIGSTDITFNNPGSGDRFFRELVDSAGYELRCYTAQSFFCETPAKTVKITGIVNS